MAARYKEGPLRPKRKKASGSPGKDLPLTLPPVGSDKRPERIRLFSKTARWHIKVFVFDNC
jgi:hypothetical protein